MSSDRARNFHKLDAVNSIKFVGLIYIDSNSDSLLYEKNFDQPLLELNKLIDKTIDKNVSTVGASVIYNSKAISKFTHILVNMNLTGNESHDLNNIGINYMQRTNRRWLVKKKLTHLPYEHGGLNLRDFKLSSISLKTFWVRVIMRDYLDQKPMWLQILEYFLTLEGLKLKYLFEIGYSHSDLKKIAYKLKEHSNFWSNTIYEIA